MLFVPWACVLFQETLRKISTTLALKNEEIQNFICCLKQSLENLEVKRCGTQSPKSSPELVICWQFSYPSVREKLFDHIYLLSVPSILHRSGHEEGGIVIVGACGQHSWFFPPVLDSGSFMQLVAHSGRQPACSRKCLSYGGCWYKALCSLWPLLGIILERIWDPSCMRMHTTVYSHSQ